MSQPARRTQAQQVSRILKRQLWVLFALIVAVWMMDVLWWHSDQLLVKSVALGALLASISQVVFAWFAFRYTGYKARRHIVNQLYRGQVAKWLITLVGFALIFITIQPLSAFALFIGFMVMQVSHSWMLWQIR